MLFTLENMLFIIAIGLLAILFVLMLIYYIKIIIKTPRIKQNEKQVKDDKSNDIDNADANKAEKNSLYLIGGASHIGARKQQQDAFFIPDDLTEDEDKGYIAVLCDGMGGMKSGDAASKMSVKLLVDEFYSKDIIEDVPVFFNNLADFIDNKVHNIKDDNGNIASAGTTMLAVLFNEKGYQWMSVGDSRIYLYKNNKLVQLTRDHNYMIELTERVKSGQITEAEAINDPQKNALISYIGMGGIEMIDILKEPTELLKDEILIMCSDGLTNAMSNSDIENIIKQTNDDMHLLTHRLVIEVFDRNNQYQDNTTVIAIKRNI